MQRKFSGQQISGTLLHIFQVARLEVAFAKNKKFRSRVNSLVSCTVARTADKITFEVSSRQIKVGVLHIEFPN